MIPLIIDVAGAYFIAKYIKNIWWSLLAAVGVGIFSPVFVSIITLLIFSNSIEGDQAARIIFGMVIGAIFIHPIVTTIALFVIRKMIRSPNHNGS